MKKFTSAAIFAIMASATPLVASADDKPYRCRDFVSDSIAFNADKSITWQEMGTDFSQATGIIVGVYFGKSGEPYSYESEGFKSFQDAVFADCKKHPSDKVAVAALRTPIGKAVEQGSYQKLTLVDLRLDIEKLKGKMVEVQGTLQSMGEISMISSGVFDMNKLFVETKELPRESRKYILENCGDGCDVIIRGKVSTVMLNPGIAARELIPQ